MATRDVKQSPENGLFTTDQGSKRDKNTQQKDQQQQEDAHQKLISIDDDNSSEREIEYEMPSNVLISMDDAYNYDGTEMNIQSS